VQVVRLGGAVVAWAALHSWLASTKMKASAVKNLGPEASRAYRLAYNVISVISFAPVAWLLWSMPDRQIYAVPAPWAFAMLGIQGTAVALAAVTLVQTGASQFAGLSQILSHTESNQLSTTGFYGLVRHPLYLFGLIFIWLTPTMSVNQLVVTIVFTAYFFIGAVLEEQRLVQEFGEVYTTYRANTPMIIPRVRRQRKS
jgi:methanethiol S-methyltransferase